MKNLIAELREMGGRLRPEAADALEQQAAVIEAMREALEAVECLTVYAHDDDEAGDFGCCGERTYDSHAKDCWTHLRAKALALQPCPEVLNKVKADVRERCAKMCEETEIERHYFGGQTYDLASDTLSSAAERIRKMEV